MTASIAGSSRAELVEPGPEETPGTNRGVELTGAFSVHWLQGTTYLPEEDVLDVVHQLTEGGDFVATKGRDFYAKGYRTVGNITVYVEPLDPATMPPVYVQVPGQGCEFLGLSKVQKLAEIIRPSRVDLAFDGAPFTPEQASEWTRQGNIRCRARNRQFVDDLSEVPEGNTLQLGSRASTRQLVMYDRRGFTRVELRLKGDRAELAYEALTGPAEALRLTALGWLQDFVDFVDTAKDSNVSRAPRLPLWEAFVSGAVRVRMALEGAPELTLERAVEWVRHQVAPTLAMLEAAGHDLVASFVRPARARLRGRHAAILAGVGVRVVPSM